MRRLALLLLLAACGDDSSGDAPDANVSEPDPDFDDTAATVEVQQ